MMLIPVADMAGTTKLWANTHITGVGAEEGVSEVVGLTRIYKKNV